MLDVLTLTINQGPRRSRLSTFFRLILVLPHGLVLILWGIAAFLAAIVAWFSILITGRYPAGLWDFVADFVRYGARVNLYATLAVDAFPPFGGGPDGYRVQLEIPRLEHYNRLKTLLRILYAIPVYIVTVILGYLWCIIGVVDWLVIVVTGRQPEGLQSAIVWIAGWSVRYSGLVTLVTETYDLEVRSSTAPSAA